MAKKKNEGIKENEELNEKVVISEITQNEEITSTGETSEELKGEGIENTVEAAEVVENTAEEKNEVVEDAKTEENASNTGEDAEMSVTEKIKIANTCFKDKYTGVTYKKGTKFIIIEEKVETIKIAENEYKISSIRAKEIGAKGYLS